MTEVERQTPYSYICFSSSNSSAVTLSLFCSLSGNIHTAAESAVSSGLECCLEFTKSLVMHNMTALFYKSDGLLLVIFLFFPPLHYAVL